MRHLRSSTALVLTGVLAVGATTATAAVKKPAPPVCNLVTDDAGDTAYLALPNSDTIDILSADVASDGKNLTGVIRVKKYTPNETSTVYGKRFIVAFEGAGLKPMYLTLLDYPVGQVFNFGSTSVDAAGRTTYTSDGAATGTIDAATGVIRISTTAAALKDAGYGTLTKGKDLSGINAVTFRRVGTSLMPGDDAVSSKKYKVGAASCVKP